MIKCLENNVRKLIIDEQPIDPKYYEKMSELLDALIKQRKQEAIEYQKYLLRASSFGFVVQRILLGAIQLINREDRECVSWLAQCATKVVMS